MSAKVDQLKLQARWQVWSVTGPEPDYSFFWALFSLAKEPSLVHLSVRPNIMVNRLKKKKTLECINSANLCSPAKDPVYYQETLRADS